MFRRAEPDAVRRGDLQWPISKFARATGWWYATAPRRSFWKTRAPRSIRNSAPRPPISRRTRRREIGTDAPGRTVQSLDGPRSAYEQVDWHAQEEQRFLTKLVVRLDAAVN